MTAVLMKASEKLLKSFGAKNKGPGSSAWLQTSWTSARGTGLGKTLVFSRLCKARGKNPGN